MIVSKVYRSKISDVPERSAAVMNSRSLVDTGRSLCNVDICEINTIENVKRLAIRVVQFAQHKTCLVLIDGRLAVLGTLS